MTTAFDYIIVGGGSSGCVLAARLSENSANRVLLIESGGKDSDRYIHIPATFFKVMGKGVDIHPYASESREGTEWATVHRAAGQCSRRR